MESRRFFGDGLDRTSTALTYVPSLDEKGMENLLLKTKSAHPYEKGKTVESFFDIFHLGREDSFPSLQQSYLDFDAILWTQAIVVKNRIPNKEKLKILHLKNYVLLMKGIFPKLSRYM